MKLPILIALPFLLTSLVLPQERVQPSNTSNSKELANWIMKLVVEKGQANEKLKRQHVTYNKKVVKSDLEKNPPKEIESSVFEIYGKDGLSIEKLIEKNGRIVRNGQPKASELDFNDILIGRYDFNIEREELNKGRGEYIISFKPKEPIEQLPIRQRIDEGINRATGLLYIDMEKFYLRRMEGRLRDTFTKAFSIFEMKDFTILFEQEEFEGIIVPGSLTLTYKYRVFWGETREKLEYSYSNRKSSYIPPPKL